MSRNVLRAQFLYRPREGLALEDHALRESPVLSGIKTHTKTMSLLFASLLLAAACAPDLRLGDSGVAGSNGESSCTPGDKQCAGDRPQLCGGDGQWEDEAECPSSAPVCSAGTCTRPSCVGLPSTCGPHGDESCCARSAYDVPWLKMNKRATARRSGGRGVQRRRG
jgi:hypothetical protein